MSTRRAVGEIEHIFRMALNNRFEQRPYRRVFIGDGGPDDVPRLGVQARAADESEGGDPSLIRWECQVTVTPPLNCERQGIDTALEVIDLLHGADLDGEDTVVIDVAFRGASVAHQGPGVPNAITVTFEVTTVENNDISLRPIAQYFASSEEKLPACLSRTGGKSVLSPGR